LRTWVNLLGYVLITLAMGAQNDPKVSLPQPSPGVVQLAPGKLDFGIQPVGVASQSKSATLINTGKTRLTISDISASGIDFTQKNTCPSVLAAGQECAITVVFKPAINEPRFGTVIISDSDPSGPHMLLLSGTGQ